MVVYLYFEIEGRGRWIFGILIWKFESFLEGQLDGVLLGKDVKERFVKVDRGVKG